MAKRFLITLLILCLFFCGCMQQSEQESKQEETTKAAEETSSDLLTIGEEALPLKLARVFVLSQKFQYGTAFGESIWQVGYQGSTFEETLKDNFRTHIALMFTSYCMAKDQGLTLTADEEKALREAGKAFIDRLEVSDAKQIDLNESDVCEALRMYLMAKKIYRQTAGSVELDLSEDETRVIRLQEIRINTEGLEGIEKDQKLTLAAEALNLLEAGEDFNTVAEKYSETSTAVYAASRDTLTAAETRAAFALATDENSAVITLPGSYVIFHCVDSFDKAASEMHRLALLQQMEDSGYKEKISLFLNKRALTWDESNWAELRFSGTDDLAKASIYSVYEEYFGEED